MENFLIIGFLVLLIIIVIVCTRKRIEQEPKTNQRTNLQQTHEMKVSGVVIKLSDSEISKIDTMRKEKDKQKFNNEKELLLSKIRNDKNTTHDLVKEKVLDELLKQNIDTDEDLERLEFIYNNGRLRTNEEVEQYDKCIFTKEKRANYNDERQGTTFLAGFVTFIITFFIVYAASGLSAGGAFLGFLIGGFASAIGIIIGHSSNIRKAKEYCIPDDDPRVQDEKTKRNIAVAS